MKNIKKEIFALNIELNIHKNDEHILQQNYFLTINLKLKEKEEI